jgi:hypothetical protein
MVGADEPEERGMEYYFTIADPLLSSILSDHKGEWDWFDVMQCWSAIGHCIVMRLMDDKLPQKTIVDNMIKIFAAKSQSSDSDDDEDLFRAYV